MALIVQKYGGSSLASPKHIQRAAKRIKALKASGKSVVVVVSAMGHTTDHLIKLAKKTVSRPPSREMDMLLTAGERISMSLLAMCLHEEGVPAISFTGSQSGIVTNNEHTQARIIDIKAHRIKEELEKGKVVIVAGFQGVSLEKEITTLGRGGSDTTAVAISAALGAERCEILTDVDGLFSADPKLVPDAHLLPFCSYDEALELASLGAKMQSRSIELAKRFNVKVRIASSFHQAERWTDLFENKTGDNMEQTLIRGVATQDGFLFYRAEVKLREFLSHMQEKQVPVRFFNFSSSTVSFLCEESKKQTVKEVLEKLNAPFQVVSGVSTLSLVGEGLSASSHVIPEFIEVLSDLNLECLLFTSNTVSLTAAISETEKERAVKAIHAKFL